MSLGLSTKDDTTETCRECYKGQVTPNGGMGRTFLLSRGCRVALPDSFQVPTCDTCGELFWSQSLREEAVALVTANLRRDGELASPFTWQEPPEEEL